MRAAVLADWGTSAASGETLGRGANAPAAAPFARRGGTWAA